MKNSHVKYENAFFLLILFILSISRVNKPQTTTMKAREKITAAISMVYPHIIQPTKRPSENTKVTMIASQK